ncbi:MAG: hypothetical protein K6C69_06705 [Lachnospiraceae bacterium]|nr:hypothetical protein [Lachnospiraceae bacterium]
MAKLYATRAKNHFLNTFQDNAGMGVIEVILIIVVLIGLVVLFKGQVTTLVNDLLSNMSSAAKKV